MSNLAPGQLLKSNLGILGAYIVISIVVTYPAILGLVHPHAIPGGHYDSKYFLWHLWWVKYAVLNLGVLPTFTQSIFHPVGGEVLLASPFSELAAVSLQSLLGLTRVYTLIWLFSFWATGFTTYLVCFYFTRDRLAGFVAGLILSFSAYHYAHGMHLGLWTLQWLPLYVLAFFLFISKMSLKRGTLVAATFVLAVMSEHVYYMLYFVMPFTGFFVLYHWVTAAPALQQRKFVLTFMGLIILSLFLVSPLYIHLLPNQDQSFIRKSGVVAGSADILAYLTPPQDNPVWQGNFLVGLYDTFQGVIAEDTIFIGYAAIILMVVGIVTQPARATRFWLWLGISAFIFSLGPILHLHGPVKLAIDNIETNITLPYALLVNLPVISLLRAPARISVIVQLCVAILAAYGLTNLIKKRTKPGRGVIAIIFGAFILVESLYQFPYPMYQNELAVPEVYKSIARENNNLAVLELPWPGRTTQEGQLTPAISTNKDFAFTFMYYATRHGHPMVGGETARTPLAPAEFLDTTAFIRELIYPVDVVDTGSPVVATDNSALVNRGAELLANHNIGYVVLHRDLLSHLDPSQRQAPELMLRQALGEPFYDDGTLAGFWVTNQDAPNPAQESVILGDGWFPKSSLTNFPVRGMGQSGSLLSYNPKQTTTRLSMTAFSVLPKYEKITLVVNDTPVETFSVSSNPQAPETHFTGAFLLSEGMNEIEFQVQSDKPAKSPNAGVHLGVYNIFQYSVLQMQDVSLANPTTINLGNEIELLGYDQNTNQETLQLTLYWRALNDVSDSYKVFIHLVDPQGNIILQQDAIPFNWLLPTNFWTPDEVIRDAYKFALSPDIPPGQYQIVVGMYSPETLERLTIYANGRPTTDDKILLSHIDVK